MTKEKKNSALRTTLARNDLHGACCSCVHETKTCPDGSGKATCKSWMADEIKIAEILKP